MDERGVPERRCANTTDADRSLITPANPPASITIEWLHDPVVDGYRDGYLTDASGRPSRYFERGNSGPYRNEAVLFALPVSLKGEADFERAGTVSAYAKADIVVVVKVNGSSTEW